MAGTQVLHGPVQVREATYGFPERDGPTMDEVRLTAVTAHGWRVSDDRLPQGDPFRLLAFVEHRGDAYEVMQLGFGFQWHEFDSMEEAIAYVVESGPRIAQERLHGEPI